MSYPILYSATETKFGHNGLGILGDCVSCEVTEEANGIFELSMQYPMDGIHYEDICDRAIIKAKADQFRDPQLFRVYAVSKPFSGIVTVLAQHISYDLSGIPVSRFVAHSASGALVGLKNNSVIDCPFDFWTDKTTNGKFTVETPASIRSRLGGVAGSILDVYGGEYEFDNYTVKLHNSRGLNRGVSVRYGKNLTDIRQDQNCASVATGVYPYWSGDVDGNTVVVELPEKIIDAPGSYNFVKIRTLDLSEEFEAQPTIEQLRSRAEKYIKTNNIGVPSVSLTVSFAQLEQSEEYRHLKLLERVALFDSVNVEFPALGVSSTAKAVKIVYDVLSDRVKAITLGSVRSNIADTIANQQQEIQRVPTKNDLERAKESATAWLTNGKGYKVERRDDSGRVIDTLYMDSPDIETAVNVMRVGQSGIGFSHNGASGPYESAWTIDGVFNADFIAGGTLYGILVKAGSISSVDGKIFIDLNENAGIPVFNTGISTNGIFVRGDEAGSSEIFSTYAVKNANNEGFHVDQYIKSTNGNILKRTTETFSSDYSDTDGIAEEFFSADGSRSILISVANDVTSLFVVENGETKGAFFLDGHSSALNVGKINGKSVEWVQNQDGTFSIVGR